MKEILITSALGQFLSFGIRKVTIQQITYPLGLSTKSVYKYFSSKEELLEACLYVQYERLFQQCVELESQVDNPILFFFQLYQNLMALDFGVNPLFYLDLNRYYPELQDKILENEIKRLTPFVMSITEAGKEQGYIRPDLPASVFIVTINAIYRLLTRSDIYQNCDSNPFELANYTVGIYLRGICTEKGIREIEANKPMVLFTEPVSSKS